MDIDVFTQLITQIGFPIAVCILCFWYINKMQTEHKEEIDKMREALNNNTLIMQKIYDKLENMEKE